MIPKNTVISLINPLIPGKAKEARELARKKANVIGKTFARPPIFGIDKVLVLSYKEPVTKNIAAAISP